jgi:hydrogenase maturation protein HypF
VWLPGGDAGVRNPYRMALSHLAAAGLAWDPRLPSVATCPPAERSVVARQLDTGLHSSPTSSMGRLFDAVASLAGVCHRVAYEAEAAMRFEELAHDSIDVCDDVYAFAVNAEGGVLVADPAPVLAAVVDDVLAGAPAALVAARFHLAVVALVGELAERLRTATGLNTAALSGGVFLNALLTTRCVDLLSANGFRVLRHRLVPPSDAGLALGQLAIAARVSTERRPRSTANRRRTSCA